jgi:AcrR family transcriptional regulator
LPAVLRSRERVLAASKAAMSAGVELPSSERSRLYRGWLTSASIALVEADGLRKLTVARILAESTVTRKAFYDAFQSAEDCLHAALAEAVEQATAQAADAQDAARSPRAGIRAALHTLLELAEQRRGLARVCLVDALGGGPQLLTLRAHALARAAGAIERGSPHGPTCPAQKELLTSEILAGAAAELLHKRLLDRDGPPLSDLYGPLMGMFVLPYEGVAAAAAECALKPPASPERPGWRAQAEVNPLRSVGLRLTERTAKVLVALAASPGSSNLQIATAAGITDQGQISKLLARLLDRGLVQRESMPGGPNSWTLTRLGKEVASATRAQ